MWSKHTGMADGKYAWAANGFKKAGEGWDQFTMIAAAGNGGVIYGVRPNGDLMWSKHTGRGNGEYTWATDDFKKVGEGWSQFASIVAGGMDGVLYGVQK
jgi:hypothetical protein